MQMVTVVLLGPDLKAVSGISTHLSQLFDSQLSREFRLLHFQVGSEGRSENRVQRFLRYLTSPWRFLWFMLRTRPDIVHINTAMETKAYWRDIAFLAVARWVGAKVVYQVHGGFLPNDFFAGRWVLTAVLRRVLRAADIIILLSSAEYRAYSEFEPRLRCRVVPNAIQVAAKDIPKKRNHAAPLRLVYVGRLVAAKGLFEIVEAIERLKKIGVRVDMIFAGTGPDEGRLQERVAELALTDCVQFVGAVFGEAKEALWLDADVFVFPSYHREGLPYAVLEAMAARTAPVVSPVGGIPDVIDDGVHGLFVPAKDPSRLVDTIRRLDADRTQLERFGEAGRRRVLEYYRVERLADDFAHAYREL